MFWEGKFAIFYAEYRAAYIKAGAEGSGGSDDGDSDGGNGGGGPPSGPGGKRARTKGLSR